ncbi:serine--tRNA ligase [Asticcacaulis excentricus]|uniref:Serine--tRNA ligase n=1 Tax=Asticcacaulis excentricus (strain ATCC 15261 / DSM 4724 / KCTC 12464 / NCIMB 9791 / VKM B-1370 / CB 48) TaxID=573065 RepID=E8RP49_ASTEC|nr:serine--tRNA ligase [Asticcacaulis excentricus]ADU13019.1 seryl-tRNA synthetase [Asticcacaulis excentricus CB 48]
MHDIKALRETPEAYVRGWSSRGRESAQADVDALLTLDKDLRAAKTTFETNQAQLKKLSGEIGKAKAQKDEARAAELMTEVEGLKGAIAVAQETERQTEEDLRTLLASLPNIPFEDVPLGEDEAGNVEIRRHGAPNILSFLAKDHADLGEALKGPTGPLMDFEAAARMSGSRFVVLKGQLARLERAIGQWMLDTQTTEHGYTEVNPPVLVRENALFGTGQLPKFEEDLFKAGLTFSRERLAGQAREAGIELKSLDEQTYELIIAQMGENARYLIPTAEVSLTNLVREAITAEEELPLRLTALTNCFRAEAGSAGRDTKGMIRQHQFQKVELVSITTPEQSAAEHERMTECAEAILKKLDLSFRTMLLCTGDMGFGARKTYDLEVWLPSQNTYREISSCSNCGDFQARRMDARTRKAGEKGTRFLHTLNGSGLAVGRTLVAIMENYQDEGGRIAIPSVLQPYMGGLTHIG